MVRVIPTPLIFHTFRVRVSAVPGTKSALARCVVRLARRFGQNRFIGEAPMNVAEAAVLPEIGRPVNKPSFKNRS